MARTSEVIAAAPIAVRVSLGVLGEASPD